MNERIGKLAEQANSHHDNFFDLNYKELDVFLEKFAELIVGEMLQTCEDHPGWSGRMIGEEIKKHFGFEK